MKDNTIRIKTCPRCGKTYHGAPALSREDNETREALASIGVDEKEQALILETIHRSYGQE